MKKFKYFLFLAIIIAIVVDSFSNTYTIEGKKDPRLHQAYYLARYTATSTSGFNCSVSNWNTGGSNPAHTSMRFNIDDDDYKINIPYNLPIYKDFSLGCGFKLTQIELIIRHPGEYDDETYDHGNTGDDKEFSILENYDYHKNSTFHAGWKYDIKNPKKYFKVPRNTQLFCHTESQQIKDDAEATEQERKAFALGEKTSNLVRSNLFCSLNAPRPEYTYYYAIQNKQKVVTHITHPDIGTDIINDNEHFHIDIAVDEKNCLMHYGWNDGKQDRFREKYEE